MIAMNNAIGRFAPVAMLAALTAACSNTTPPTKFERTGEIIALSGGDAGAGSACIACHGLDGGGDGRLSPRLAGLDIGYIHQQLENYASGRRHHPQMSWIADKLDWDARGKVAAFYAGLPVPPLREETGGPMADRASIAAACDPAIVRLYHEGDTQRGIVACASCHGEDGAGVGQGNPPLAGQPAPYLAEQLRRWRDGERHGDALGQMTRISRRLHAAEVEPLSDYSARLAGGRNRPGSPAACPPARRPYPRSGA